MRSKANHGSTSWSFCKVALGSCGDYVGRAIYGNFGFRRNRKTVQAAGDAIMMHEWFRIKFIMNLDGGEEI